MAILLTHIVHHKNYISYKQQVKLMQDINSGGFENTPKDFYNNLEVELPNLGFTSLPLKALKAVYIQVNQPDSINKALDLLHKGIKDNPYIMFSEGNLAQYYYAIRNYDSAFYYARKSFKGLPKNAIHFAMISKLYANKGYYDSIIITNELINKELSTDISKIYFASMINFIDKVNDSLRTKVISQAIIAKEKSLKEKELQLMADILIKGKEDVNKALEFEYEGEKFLAEKKYTEGINMYKNALEIRENNLNYISTIGLAYFNLSEYNLVIEYFNKLTDLRIELDPLSLYIKGQSHIRIGEREKACESLKKASDFGFEKASVAFKKYCSYNE